MDICTCPDHLLMNTCGISPCTVMWFNKLGNLHILSLCISQPQIGNCYHFRNYPLQHYHLTTSYLLISGFLKLIEIKQSYQATLLTPFRKIREKILYRLFKRLERRWKRTQASFCMGDYINNIN